MHIYNIWNLKLVFMHHMRVICTGSMSLRAGKS
uniref:Uncharacterized protein n=1 Tax=Arundo donax TaxID=35708 RepID=A0A0A9AHV7_ARUDO